MLISLFIAQNVPIKKYKAPKGFLFEVWDIHVAIETAGANQVLVVPYLVEDEVTTLGDVSQEFLASASSNVAGTFFDFNFTKGEKTKYLSIGRVSGTAFGLRLIVHYTLVKASKTELIMEWFRKGR